MRRAETMSLGEASYIERGGSALRGRGEMRKEALDLLEHLYYNE